MIKVVAFDFDDTLYSGIDYKPWINFCKNAIWDILKFHSQNEFNKIQNFVSKEKFSDKNIIAFIREFGLNEQDWFKYKDAQDRQDETLHVEKVVSNEELNKFAKNHVLYVVSNSTRKAVFNNIEKLGINLSCFKEIITNPFIFGRESKQYLYKEILNKEKILPNELFVIGNSYNDDILPALEIGAKGQVVNNADFTYEDFNLM